MGVALGAIGFVATLMLLLGLASVIQPSGGDRPAVSPTSTTLAPYRVGP
jgi:hypothetical protein